MAVTPQNLASMMADVMGRNTYLSTRSYITEEMHSKIMAELSPQDKEKYLCELYIRLGFEKFKGETGFMFMKGSQKRYVPFAPKNVKDASKVSVTAGLYPDVSLYWLLHEL